MKPADLAELLRHRTEELISFFGINTSASVQMTPDAIEIDVASESAGLLIGHRGETLRALEYLLGAYAQREAPDLRLWVHLDIAGYRQARATTLANMAKSIAARVVASGAEEACKPMNPAERRIVHMALAAIPEVVTESRGEGRDRHIVVLPRP